MMPEEISPTTVFIVKPKTKSVLETETFVHFCSSERFIIPDMEDCNGNVHEGNI